MSFNPITWEGFVAFVIIFFFGLAINRIFHYRRLWLQARDEVRDWKAKELEAEMIKDFRDWIYAVGTMGNPDFNIKGNRK